MSAEESDAPVRKSVTVRATLERAFSVFTEDLDSWWPRSHHIGSSPMKCAVIECRAGGRVYSTQTDGSECDWGTVLVWEPPHRLVLAWQIDGNWKYEPERSKSSEVHVTFVSEGRGKTRVDLEHRHIGRTSAAAKAVRAALDGPQGWTGMLRLYSERVVRDDVRGGIQSETHS